MTAPTSLMWALPQNLRGSGPHDWHRGAYPGDPMFAHEIGDALREAARRRGAKHLQILKLFAPQPGYAWRFVS